MSGLYVMVVCAPEASAGVPVVSAIKLANLTDNDAHATMWPAEVEEMHAVIRENHTLC